MIDDLFFDTDCLSAFLWINDTNILQTLYGGKIVLPEPVYQELSNPSIPHIKKRADSLINSNVASVQQINVGTEEYKIYNALIKGEKGKKQIGKGEAAGIALARQYNGILASNNYKDITPYIKKYRLKHIDAGHILMDAMGQNMITESDGNVIWKKMLAKNRKLPEPTFSEYLKKNSPISFD